MKSGFLTSCLLLGLLLGSSCNLPNSGGGHSHGSSDTLDTAAHGHHHGGDEANEFMHQSDFDELVERFEDPEREEWQQSDLVIEKLGNLQNKVVADIGSGTGYFSFRIAPQANKVIAIDIDERFLNFIDQRKAKEDSSGLLDIETRLTKPNTPSLSPQEADLAIIVNTYHHIENREEYFSKVRYGLKKGGVLAVVDFKKEDLPVGPPTEMKVTMESVRDELKSAGFERFELDNTSLKYQYIVLAN